MLPFTGSSRQPARRAQLQQLIEQLPDEAVTSLLDYADYLLQRHGQRTRPLEQPKPLPRPEQESVVAAMKRLRECYHMLDHSKMLHECSGLMAQHLMQGREATAVIDELEQVFSRHYETYLNQYSS